MAVPYARSPSSGSLNIGVLAFCEACSPEGKLRIYLRLIGLKTLESET